jgi:transposase-like protein
MTIVNGAKASSASQPEASPIAPTACPVCRSTALTTAAKHIDASTYWRCSRCGEVWNVARREAGRRSPRW